MVRLRSFRNAVSACPHLQTALSVRRVIERELRTKDEAPAMIEALRTVIKRMHYPRVVAARLGLKGDGRDFRLAGTRRLW